jgi:hypothetical protein
MRSPFETIGRATASRSDEIVRCSAPTGSDGKVQPARV